MIEWKRLAPGDYAGSIGGRRVARIRRNPAGHWAASYRGPSMGTAKFFPPSKRLADAKAKVVSVLFPGTEEAGHR